MDGEPHTHIHTHAHAHKHSRNPTHTHYTHICPNSVLLLGVGSLFYSLPHRHLTTCSNHTPMIIGQERSDALRSVHTAEASERCGGLREGRRRALRCLRGVIPGANRRLSMQDPGSFGFHDASPTPSSYVNPQKPTSSWDDSHRHTSGISN